MPNIKPEEEAEHWMISCSDDGNSEHQIRYQAPQGQIEGVSIYVRDADEWILMDTEFMGIYYLFTIEGTEAEIAVCLHAKGIMDYLAYIILCVVVLLAVVVLISRKIIKKKKAVRIDAAEEVPQ